MCFNIFESKNAILFHRNITKLPKNMQIFMNKSMMKIYCISSYFNFMYKKFKKITLKN